MGPKGPWAFIKWTETYGALYKLQFLDVFAVVLTDPDTIARITKKTGALEELSVIRPLLPQQQRQRSTATVGAFQTLDSH